MKRAWINQPSTNQPLHHLHGTLVLVDESSAFISVNNIRCVTVWHVKGDIERQNIPSITLSDGWPEHLK